MRDVQKKHLGLGGLWEDERCVIREYSVKSEKESFQSVKNSGFDIGRRDRCRGEKIKIKMEMGRTYNKNKRRTKRTPEQTPRDDKQAAAEVNLPPDGATI